MEYQAIAQQLCSDDVAHDITSGLYDDEGITWKGWVFEESRRRLALISRLNALLPLY